MPKRRHKNYFEHYHYLSFKSEISGGCIAEKKNWVLKSNSLSWNLGSANFQPYDPGQTAPSCGACFFLCNNISLQQLYETKMSRVPCPEEHSSSEPLGVEDWSGDSGLDGWCRVVDVELRGTAWHRVLSSAQGTGLQPPSWSPHPRTIQVSKQFLWRNASPHWIHLFVN